MDPLLHYSSSLAQITETSLNYCFRAYPFPLFCAVPAFPAWGFSSLFLNRKLFNIALQCQSTDTLNKLCLPYWAGIYSEPVQGVNVSGTGGYLKIEHAFNRFTKHGLRACYVQLTRLGVRVACGAVELAHALMALTSGVGEDGREHFGEWDVQCSMQDWSGDNEVMWCMRGIILSLLIGEALCEEKMFETRSE